MQAEGNRAGFWYATFDPSFGHAYERFVQTWNERRRKGRTQSCLLLLLSDNWRHYGKNVPPSKQKLNNIARSLQTYEEVSDYTTSYIAAVLTTHTEKNKERLTLNTQSARVSPELSALEQRLSCIIEGIEKDQLLIRFSQVDPSEPEREFSLVIDVSNQTYKGMCNCIIFGSSNSRNPQY